MKKRILSFLLVFCFVTALLPLSVSAATSYDANAAIAYAKDHWNDGVGLCAEFVSNCLKAGGCSAWSASCTALVGQLQSGGYGTLNKLTVESNGKISASKNSGKVSPGDPIFCYCSSETDGKPYVHVYLCGDTDSSDYLKGYAHNNARNNETIVATTCGFCGSKLTAVYAFHMNSSANATASFASSSATLSPGSTKNITVNFSGDGIASVSCGTSNEDACHATLPNVDWNKGTATVTLEGKIPGNFTAYFWLWDSNNNIIKRVDMPVTVSSWSATMTTSKNSVSMNLVSSPTASFTIQLGGTFSESSMLQAQIANPSIVSSSWSNYTNGNTINVTLTAKQTGSTTITYCLVDNNTNTTQVSTTISVTVTAPTYTVSYNANGGSGAPGAQTKTYQQALTLSSTRPSRAGYTFKGWATSSSASTAQYQPGSSYTSDSNITLYAVWEPASGVTYTVRHYQQNAGEGYTLADTETLTGTTGSSVTPSRKNYTGFQSPSAQTAVISADGSTVVSYYYNRESYTIRFDANGGSGAPETQTKAYQVPLVLSSVKPTRNGYNFYGWATSANATAPQYSAGEYYAIDGNVTLYAIWVPASDITYMVRHYQENLDGGYTLIDTETLTGTTGKSVSPATKNYLGFKVPAVQSAVVAADSSTVVSYYYELENYSLTLQAGNGIQSVNGGGTYRYGDAVTVTAQIESNYEWSAWISSTSNLGSSQQTYQFTMPAANVTLSASAQQKNGDIQSGVSSLSGLSNFKETNLYYNGLFKDVSASDWYSDNVASAYRLNLMNGVGANFFAPGDNVTIAQAVTLAARLHSIYQTGRDNFETYDSGNWYDPYVNYIKQNGLLAENYDYNRPATREEFAHILASAFPKEALPALRTNIMDFADAGDIVHRNDIELLYMAGVINGTIDAGVLYFKPNSTITRAEAAAIVTRMAQMDLRMS